MLYLRETMVVVAAMALAAGAAAQESKVKTAFLNPADAGPDFVVQGEYVGEVGEAKYGAQVVARGDGKFEAWLLRGGLPGAGWDGKTRLRMSGATQDAVTKLQGEGLSATIAREEMTVQVNGEKGVLQKIERQSPTVGMKPPAGAIVLFDGTNVDAWEPGKLEADMLMGVGTRTRQKFDSFTLHLEFRTPFMPYATGQARGNSGMYLQDQYECQILDSFGLEGLDNECGGIYSNSRPLVNMCLPPLTWQTYDVEFQGAKFDANGELIEPARCTIKHNGVVIHDNLPLKTTPGGGQRDQKPGALYLQDHGDPVRFRNIWIVEKK
uniref:DUF1080 domain-containing protein n=1 Tax=Schlesneria paludicola TaxID=360056 RepID=A0A7C4QS98_9PLAN